MRYEVVVAEICYLDGSDFSLNSAKPMFFSLTFSLLPRCSWYLEHSVAQHGECCGPGTREELLVP